MQFPKAVVLNILMSFAVGFVGAETANAGIQDSATAVVYRSEGFVTTYVDGDDLSMMDMDPSGPVHTEKEIPAQIVVVVDAANADLVIRVQSDRTLFPKVAASSRNGSFDQQWKCSGFTVTEQNTKQYIPTPRARTKVMVAPVAATVVYRAACVVVNQPRAEITKRTLRLVSNAGGFVLTVEEIIPPKNSRESAIPDYLVMSGGALRREPK